MSAFWTQPPELKHQHPRVSTQNQSTQNPSTQNLSTQNPRTQNPANTAPSTQSPKHPLLVTRFQRLVENPVFALTRWHSQFCTATADILQGTFTLLRKLASTPKSVSQFVSARYQCLCPPTTRSSPPCSQTHPSRQLYIHLEHRHLPFWQALPFPPPTTD